MGASRSWPGPDYRLHRPRRRGCAALERDRLALPRRSRRGEALALGLRASAGAADDLV